MTVRIIDGRPAPDWTPSQPLSLSDFNPSSLSSLFRGYSESQASDERKRRVEIALREFDEYLKQQIGAAGLCVRLARTAQQLAADDRSLSVLFLGRPICSSPRVTVSLPVHIRVVVVNMQNEVASNDCATAIDGRHIEQSFPQAFVTPALDGSTLGAILTNGAFPSSGTRVSISGCGNASTLAAARHDAPPRPAPESIAAPPDNSAILLVGRTGSSATWGSGWIDLPNPVSFFKGEKLRIRVGGTAERVVVRLAQKGADSDSSAGVIPLIIPVPRENRIIELSLTEEKPQVVQISVHGLSNPWNEFPLGSSNGPATLISAERLR